MKNKIKINKMCICGFKVIGFSEKHIEGNMKLHLVSQNHAKNMVLKDNLLKNENNKVKKKVKK